MTQEAFKAWWYNEGSQAPYTHHDCEEHTMRMCEIAWANGAYKALAEHAMQEVQRLGQEIEPDDIASILACRDMLDAQPVPPQSTEQEPVAHLWQCIGRWSAYLASNGEQANCAPPSWLVDAVNNATTPPQRTWVGLTEQEHTDIAVECGCMSADWVFYGAAVERKLKERNT